MVFLFKIDRLANRSVFYPRSNSLIAHVIYMGENPPKKGKENPPKEKLEEEDDILSVSK